MKKRRIFLPLGVMGATIVPLATTISCGDNNNAGNVNDQPSQTPETPKQSVAKPSYPKDSEINPSAEYASAIGLTKIPKDTKQVLDKLFDEGKVWRSEPNATSMAFEPLIYYDWKEEFSHQNTGSNKHLDFNNEDWVTKGGWTTYLLDTTLDYSRSDFRIYGAFEGMISNNGNNRSNKDFFIRDVFHIITSSNGEGAEFKNLSSSDPNYDAEFDKNFMHKINPGTSIKNVYKNELTWAGQIGSFRAFDTQVQSILISVSPEGGLASIMANHKSISIQNGSETGFHPAYSNNIWFKDSNKKQLLVENLPQHPTEAYSWSPSRNFTFPMTKK